jgi:hypothetical protein
MKLLKRGCWSMTVRERVYASRLLEQARDSPREASEMGIEVHMERVEAIEEKRKIERRN